MVCALLPVKAPMNAKQRLNGFLSPSQRESLARLMFEEVLTTLCAVRGLDRIIVATSDQAVGDRAARSGAIVFEESEQRGHSHSADLASRRAKTNGAATVLLLPIDVPLVTRIEIEELIEAARLEEAQPGVIVVPSLDGTGTNALVRTPPEAIPSCFGPGSFRAHLDRARERGVPAMVKRPPGLLFDIDTPEDVDELFRRAPDSRIAQWLRTQWPSAS
ncbi:MAG TPA: 2-phospho-L-lactate guanylyltransferase [Bryobacteraceae bacterium]